MSANLPDKAIQKLDKALLALNIHVSENELEKLYRYFVLLTEKNKVMNLTAITEYDDVINKHFADSLAPLSFPETHEILSIRGIKILDLGTGAGFPGLPLAIALPQAEIILADSLQKRTRFLQEVKDELQISNIYIVNGRAEDLGKDIKYRESNDVVVSRAVADLRVLSEYCLPLVRENGSFLSWKGTNAEKEIETAENAIKELGGKTENIYRYTISEEQRIIIHTKKTGKTPEKYPRRAGIPSKRPL